MGGAVTSNVTKNIQKTLTTVSQKQVQQAAASSNSSNQIDWNCDNNCTISIGNIDQSNTASLNVKQIASALTNTSIQTQLGAMLKQKAISMNQDFNIFQVSVASNMTENFQGVTNNINSDIKQLCGAKSNQENMYHIDMGDGGTIKQQVKTMIKQTNGTNILANCAQDAVSQDSTITDIQSKISQAASAVNKGVDITKMMLYMIIGMVVLLIAVPVTFGVMFKSIFKKDMLIILVTLGGIGASIGCYFGNVLGTTEDRTLMNNYTYTKMCPGATPYDKTDHQAGNVDAAVKGCHDDEKCKGVSYGPKKGGGGVTTRYSLVPDGCRPQSQVPPTTSAACGKCNKADQLWTGTTVKIVSASSKEACNAKVTKECDATCDPSTFKPAEKQPRQMYSQQHGWNISVPSWSDKVNCGSCGPGDILKANFSTDPKGKGVCTMTVACDACSLNPEDTKQCNLCSTGLSHMTCTTAVLDAAHVASTEQCLKPDDGSCKEDECYDDKLNRGDVQIPATSLKGKKETILHRNNIWFAIAAGVLVLGCALLFFTQPKSNKRGGSGVTPTVKK